MDCLIKFLKKIYKNPKIALLSISVTIFIIKLLISNTPSPELSPELCMDYRNTGGCGFVFDEAHYVPAVRKLLGGIPANNEHPPLSKFLMASGILLFGDNAFGWRFFIILLGSISVFLVGLIVLEFTGKSLSAYASSILFATDVMSFNLSSIAMLDGPGLTFGLASIYFAIKKRYILAGTLFGLSLLCKLSYTFLFGAILFLYLLLSMKHKGAKIQKIMNFVKCSFLTLASSIAVFIAGIWIYDYAYKAFDSPVEHMRFMLDYHSTLTYKDPSEIDMPFSWINPISPFKAAAYYVVSVQTDGSVFHPVAYWGIFSPLWWSIWVIVPLFVFYIVKGLMRGELKVLELFIVAWILFTYIPCFPIAHVLKRYVYQFYFYPTIPSLAIGVSRFIDGKDWEVVIPVIFISSQLMWFFIYFPVKTELHISLLRLLNLPA